MDDYPTHLAPTSKDSAAEQTFEAWWRRVQPYFPQVPENVARHWLHEHWGHSPYCFLKSADYRFTLTRWPASRLFEVLSLWNRFNPNHDGCLAYGESQIEDPEFGEPYPTAAHMLEHQDFPAPVIILDNRDGLVSVPGVGYELDRLPASYVLIEGHRRFNIALHLHRTGRLRAEVDIWLMERAANAS